MIFICPVTFKGIRCQHIRKCVSNILPFVVSPAFAVIAYTEDDCQKRRLYLLSFAHFLALPFRYCYFHILYFNAFKWFLLYCTLMEGWGGGLAQSVCDGLSARARCAAVCMSAFTFAFIASHFEYNDVLFSVVASFCFSCCCVVLFHFHGIPVRIYRIKFIHFVSLLFFSYSSQFFM